MKPKLDNARQWEWRRSVLSHDVLKNEVIPAVSKLVKICSGQVRDPEFEETFVQSVGNHLHQLLNELHHLIESAEIALSPRQFFVRPPLCEVDEETKQWLPDLVHKEWMRRFRLEQQLSQVLTTLKYVEDSFSELAECWPAGIALRSKQSLKLRDSLGKLSAALTAMAGLIPYRSVMYRPRIPRRSSVNYRSTSQHDDFHEPSDSQTALRYASASTPHS